MSWSSSDSEQDEECNEFIRHVGGGVICFNLRSFRRYSKVCNSNKENLCIDNISERFSGGAMVLRLNMDGSRKGQSKPWMTVHQNSRLILNSPIVFDDVSISQTETFRVLLFVKNYANRENCPIKRFCEFKFHSAFEATLFIETYKKVMQEIVEMPRSADSPDTSDTSNNEEECIKRDQETDDVSVEAPTASIIDIAKLNLDHHQEVEDDGCDYYDDEDFDDLCEDTQDPYASCWHK